MNKTADWVKGQTSREICAMKNLKLKLIREQIEVKRADRKNLRAEVNGDFRGILAKKLGRMKQEKEGATAGGQMFRHAFIAKLGRQPGMYRRVGKARFPVRSVRIPIYEEAQATLKNLVGEQISDHFDHAFMGALKGIKGAL